MWLSIIGTITLIFLSCALAALQALGAEKLELKKLFTELKADLKGPEHDGHSMVVQVVGFAKLWFRKQFALIDAELAKMDRSLIRTGLIAIREEYQEQEMSKTLNWQIERMQQRRLQRLSILEGMQRNLLPLGLLIGLSAYLVEAALAESTLNVAHAATPIFIILLAALAMKTLALAPLTTQLYKHFNLESEAQRVCAEGLMMIHQKKTPAQIRAMLEGMMDGLEVFKGVHSIRQPQQPRNAPLFGRQKVS